MSTAFSPVVRLSVDTAEPEAMPVAMIFDPLSPVTVVVELPLFLTVTSTPVQAATGGKISATVFVAEIATTVDVA